MEHNNAGASDPNKHSKIPSTSDQAVPAVGAIDAAQEESAVVAMAAEAAAKEVATATSLPNAQAAMVADVAATVDAAEEVATATSLPNAQEANTNKVPPNTSAVNNSSSTNNSAASGGPADHSPGCSTPMTSNKTTPPQANQHPYSPQQPIFAPQPFQPILHNPAAAAYQSPGMNITQSQFSPAFSPKSPNIDYKSYQHSILAKLNDTNNQHSTFEEVITHPSHPFGKQFWDLAISNIHLPKEFLGFDLILDVFPMVYTILSNLQLGLVQKTNGGLNLNRSIHKNVDIMHVLPHTINKLVENKVFRHLSSSSGGDGGGEDPDDGDDGGFDDLSSDEEDLDEKMNPEDEANMSLGYRESTKDQIKLSLSNNRKMAASLAVMRLFVEVITKVASGMSEHHYQMSSKCRTLALFTDSVNRGEDDVQFYTNELVSSIFNSMFSINIHT
eukprot:scaffold72361_cov40-Cyclotella_meneghiniana.AAC.1